MKKYLLTSLTVGVLTLAAALSAPGQSFSDVEGKWTINKKSPRFGEATQTLEFKAQKFTFRVVSKEGKTLLFAKGRAKVEKLGPFNVLKLTEIEGGSSETNLESTDDRAIVYASGGDSLSMAMNFDQSREGEETECDTYSKAKN